MAERKNYLAGGICCFFRRVLQNRSEFKGHSLSDSEVEAVVDFVIEQQKAQYQEEMIPTEIEEVAAT